MGDKYPPIFPLWLKAYLLDTTSFDNGMHGAYLMLLFECWRQGGYLPSDDDDELRRLARCTEDEWERVRKTVLRKFDDDGSHLTQDKLTEVLAGSLRYLEQKSEAGKASGESRRNKRALNERSNERSNTCTNNVTESLNLESNNKNNVVESRLPAGLTSTVFEYWQKVMNHPLAKLSDKRRHRIAQAHRNGFTAEQMMMAVDGCAHTPHNMGQNQAGQRYDDLELILRDVEHIERFIANAPSYEKPERPEVRRRQAQAEAAHERRMQSYMEGNDD